MSEANIDFESGVEDKGYSPITSASEEEMGENKGETGKDDEEMEEDNEMEEDEVEFSFDSVMKSAYEHFIKKY